MTKAPKQITPPPPKKTKQKQVKTRKRHQNFDYTTIADRLRTVSRTIYMMWLTVSEWRQPSHSPQQQFNQMEVARLKYILIIIKPDFRKDKKTF